MLDTTKQVRKKKQKKQKTKATSNSAKKIVEINSTLDRLCTMKDIMWMTQDGIKIFIGWWKMGFLEDGLNNVPEKTQTGQQTFRKSKASKNCTK